MENKRKELIDTFIAINSQINLSAIRDPEGIEIKHIKDSLELNSTLKLRPGTTLCDVGTGGGFPLLPIAMSNPEVECTGIDATRKKVNAINAMIKTLKIPNAKAVRTRAEDFKGQSTGFDYVTARSLGYIDKILPRINRLVKKGGVLILYKQYTEEEEADIIKFAKKYRLVIVIKHPYTLFEGDIKRIIYVLKKI